MSWQENVISTAAAEIGVTEYPSGSNKVKYNTWYYSREVSGLAYPWCMVFVQWVFDHAGCRLPHKTASCSNLLGWYKRNRPECVSDTPVPGAIVIYTFGHTGVVVKDNRDGTITAIEGNTSATEAGSQSNGGGVFKPTRSKTLVEKYIIPFDIEEDEDMTGEEIYKKLTEYLLSQNPPAWVEQQGEYAEAIREGITDGSEPTRLTTRYESAIMNLRALKKARGE